MEVSNWVLPSLFLPRVSQHTFLVKSQASLQFICTVEFGHHFCNGLVSFDENNASLSEKFPTSNALELRATLVWTPTYQTSTDVRFIVLNSVECWEFIRYVCSDKKLEAPI